MPIPVVQAPVSLLIDPKLTAAAKVLWLAARASEPATPGRLAAASGLTLPTVRKGLSQLETSGWGSPLTGPSEYSPVPAKVSIPTDLLADRQVRPQAKLLYGVLQTCAISGEFTYASLSARAQVSVVTVRQAVQELVQAGWMQVSQAHQLAPLRFALRNPEMDRRSAEVARTKRRLEDADFRGEAIMKEYLSLLIDSDEFEDNARPGFLVNPLTDERMELDRYYSGVVAFEFNGAQHYRTTQRFPSQKALTMQQLRDLMKEALCARRGVRVVVVNPEDLNLETMRRKVGTLLPLRNLHGHEEVVQFLEKVSRSYQL